MCLKDIYIYISIDWTNVQNGESYLLEYAKEWSYNLETIENGLSKNKAVEARLICYKGNNYEIHTKEHSRDMKNCCH